MFIAVGVIHSLSEWIIRDDVKHQVDVAIIDELMRSTGRIQNDIAFGNRYSALFAACETRAGKDNKQLPLRAMRMIWTRLLTWRHAQDFQVEWMPRKKLR